MDPAFPTLMCQNHPSPSAMASIATVGFFPSL
jgi:hypothetical protein